MLAEALALEIAEHLERYAQIRDEQGRQQVVRNGYSKERKIVTGVGEVEITQPRVRDKRNKSEREKFTSKILPPYLRKAKTIDEFIPILYLRGVSTGDMESTLRALLGENTKGLSAQTVSRLKMRWKNEYETWSKRSLADKNYVYVWADGVYFTPRQRKHVASRMSCRSLAITRFRWSLIFFGKPRSDEKQARQRLADH